MSTRRCCCGRCPLFCVPVGNSFCAIETAERYSLDPSYPVETVGTGDLCCETIFDWIREPQLFTETGHLCTWIDGLSDSCGSIALEVTSSSAATVTLTLASGKTIVWVADPGYDPLCTSLFTYSAVDSDPPTTCSWYRYVCVIPHNSCCPEGHFPSELYVTIDEVTDEEATPSFCPCAEDPPTAYTLYAEPDGTWKGIIDVGSCETQLNLTLQCIEHELLGWVMQLTATTDSGGCLEKTQLADGSNTAQATCDPFLFVFTGFVFGDGTCCEFFGYLNLTISE